MRLKLAILGLGTVLAAQPALGEAPAFEKAGSIAAPAKGMTMAPGSFHLIERKPNG